MCSLHLTHPSAHTWSSGQPTVRRLGSSRGLMDRALDLKPEVTQGCGFESRLWQEVSTTEVRPLSKAPNPRALQCRLPTAPLGWVKCREHISLLIILCIIVYVTNKAHLSLICICCSRGLPAGAGIRTHNLGLGQGSRFLYLSHNKLYRV